MTALAILPLLLPGLLPQPASLDGNSVFYDGTTLTYHDSSTYAGLPSLPVGTRMETMGPATHDGFDGFLTIGGHLALTVGSSFYNYGVQLKRCMESACLDSARMRRAPPAPPRALPTHSFPPCTLTRP